MVEDKNLSQAYPINQVQFEGENLMNTHQDSFYQSKLGRTLRRTLFGIKGLVNEMMNSESSYSGSEASTEKTVLFDGIWFNERLIVNLIVKSNINRMFNSNNKTLIWEIWGLVFFCFYIRHCLDVVKQKYPFTPRLALKKAKDSANRAGRERRSYLKKPENLEHSVEATTSTQSTITSN